MALKLVNLRRIPLMIEPQCRTSDDPFETDQFSAFGDELLEDSFSTFFISPKSK